MDTELLVEERINGGQKLVDLLVRDGFDVAVAFWARTSGEREGSLYIGSASADPEKIGDTYRRVYTCLSQIPDASLSLSDIKMLHASNPVCVAARAIRDRYPGMVPTQIQGKQLASLHVEEAYIYPPAVDVSKPVVVSVVRDMKVDQQAKSITVFKKKIVLPPGTRVGKSYTIEYSAEYPNGKLSERSVDDAIRNLPAGWTYNVVEE